MATEINILGNTFVPFIDREEIQRRVQEIGAQISKDYAGEHPLMIAILNGSFIFAADLFRSVTVDAAISFVKLASYKGTTSTGNVISTIGLDENLRDRHVIIVEDIIDTGKTLNAFLPEIYERRPASVKIATFLLKPDALQYDIKPDYTGFEIANKFVLGYGLDYDGHGRNLPDLHVLK